MNVAVSSRVRLARNINGLPYPVMLTKAESQKVLAQVEKSSFFEVIPLQGMKLEEKTLLQEKNYITKEMLGEDLARAYGVYRGDRERLLLINEEDHLRFQVVARGLMLFESLEDVIEMERTLGETLVYDYHPQYGYTTSCVTNVGTGLRASVLLHLPLLQRLGELESKFEHANLLGIAVRGYRGESTMGMGNLYQVSNHFTLGLTEEEIVKTVHEVASMLAKKETEAWELLSLKDRSLIEDQLYRSLGLLKYARRLNWEEAMAYLSDLRLGLRLSLFKGLGQEQVDDLFFQIEKGYLEQGAKGKKKAPQEVLRADFIRERLEDIDEYI